MNKEILFELANRWIRESKPPVASDKLKGNELATATEQGIRQGKRECADGLRLLIDLLG